MIRIMLVVDDRDSLLVFSEYLKIKGMDVVGTAQDGKTAVKMYSELKPDLLIVDIEKSKSDIDYVITNVFNEDLNAKIILITTNPKLFEKYSTKVIQIFQKPFQPEQMIDDINAIEFLKN